MPGPVLPDDTNAERELRALILDYGNVLSHDQPANWFARVADRLGVSDADLRTAYWSHRAGYDAGLPAAEYWQQVLASLPGGAERLRASVDWLIQADVASWTEFREEMWTLAKRFRDRGGRTAVLSNGVVDVTAAIRARRSLESWFDVVVVSCEVGCAKPDPQIYRLCLSRLAVDAADALFVDDRLENVEAAAALGLQTLHFVGTDALDRLRALIGDRAR